MFKTIVFMYVIALDNSGFSAGIGNELYFQRGIYSGMQKRGIAKISPIRKF